MRFSAQRLVPLRLVPLLTAFLLAIETTVPAVALDLFEYLPDGRKYNEKIPKPKDFLGFEIGQRHLQHHELLGYLEKLTEVSKRASWFEYGRTHGGRPLMMLVITSPENHARMDEILDRHGQLVDPQNSSALDLADMPAVINMGYSVHGDESSASNCVPIVAYHLVAARGKKIRELLEKTVILIDPCLNPDGLERFANWANNHRGAVLNADRNHREHQQAWPPGRTNYYWFDLNRDWLPAQHPESQGRLEQFHRWLPNVLLDFHEMGTDSTYFFQPGIAARNHPLIPERTYKLTDDISRYHARALDSIGSLYFTRENFDDFYLGKGSSYPDLHGGVGILFEQASSRGHVQESVRGDVPFPFTIRNQVRTSLSSLEATLDKRVELLENMRSFYRDALSASANAEIKCYLFTAPFDPARMFEFAAVLKRHRVEAHWLKQDITVKGQVFRAADSLVVAAKQREYLFLRALFDRPTQFAENIFYDTSAWTLPAAFNLRFAELPELPDRDWIGASIDERAFPTNSVAKAEQGESDESKLPTAPLAYILDYRGYYAPRALMRLLAADVRVQVAMKPLKLREYSATIPAGSLAVFVGNQHERRDRIEELVGDAVGKDGLQVWATRTGLTPEGIDLGSSAMRQLRMPKVLLAIGTGVTPSEAGEVWHLLDRRFGLPVSLVEGERLGGIELGEYTHVVLPSGSYSNLSETAIASLRTWLQKGGTLVSLGSAIRALEARKLATVRFRSAPKTDPPANTASVRKPFAEAETNADLQLISGAIFQVEIDTTHPLGYGFTDDRLYVFRDQRIFMEPSTNPYSTPAIYPDLKANAGQVSGYISKENLTRLAGTASVLVEQVGSGRIIAMVDNPNFRAYWYGSNRLFLNALFFGQFAVEPAGD